MDSRSLVEQLRALDLWPEEQTAQDELTRLQEQHSDGRVFTKQLLERNVLTPYQANQILTGKADSLVVGPYRVLERLGEGASALVFKARHSRIHRFVAIKLIRADRAANPTSVKRFLREAEAAAQLSHPNVVRAYDADTYGDSYYFAMEFLEGIDLSRMAKKMGPMPIDQSVNYALQAARGLQHVHENGMVHRDIKPGNLMIVHPPGMEVSPSASVSTVKAAGRFGLLKILDLGLARLAEDPDAANQKAALTKLGAVMGTPDYMPPEQAMHSRHADIRSDIYSLGCTLYRILAGRTMFPGGTAVEKMLKHQLDEPTPIEELRDEVPPALRFIINKMIAKRPDDRYQSPMELATALEIFSDSGPVAAIPVTPDPAPGAITMKPTPAPTIAAPASATAARPSASQYADEFAFDEAGQQPIVASSRTAAPPEQTEWNLWILVTCVAIVGMGLLMMILGLMMG